MKPVAFFTVSSCLLLAAVLPCRMAFAQDADEAQYTAVALARTKAEVALHNCHITFDETRNGWRVAQVALDGTRARIADAIAAAREAEERKGEDARNNDLLADLGARASELERKWETFNAVERSKADGEYHDAAGAVERLNAILDALAQVDRPWKETGVDMAALRAAYEALAKRAAEARTAGQKAIEQLQQFQKAWEAELEEVKKQFPGK